MRWFFFSSRRRHTRLQGDWSSDVCSSDLLSSSYNIGLSYELSGAVLSQPGLRGAQENAAEADVGGAATSLANAVTQQYLTVLQTRQNADVARRQLDRNEEFLKLAQARYAVGRATLIDVRQAQVARGQAEVALLRAQTQVSVEKLRLFEQLGVTAPVDVETVQLTDSFAVLTPTWVLNDLLTMAEAQNPPLQALRARERAAGWGVKVAASSYGPTLSLSAAWSGFTQKYTQLDPIIRGQQGAGEERGRARGLAVRRGGSQAFLPLQSAYRPIATQDTNPAAARGQLQPATELYRVGWGTFFELLDAQVAALRAESEYVTA